LRLCSMNPQCKHDRRPAPSIEKHLNKKLLNSLVPQSQTLCQ
jgi:hypothetical protein